MPERKHLCAVPAQERGGHEASSAPSAQSGVPSQILAAGNAPIAFANEARRDGVALIVGLVLIFSPDSRFLAIWTWGLATASPGAMTAALRVFDARSGHVLERIDLSGAAAPRQALLGLPSPAWVLRSSILLLPVLGDASAVELLNVGKHSRARVALGADGGVSSPNGVQQLREFLKDGKN